jgi:membrane fusion protein, multidrug efflux system
MKNQITVAISFVFRHTKALFATISKSLNDAIASANPDLRRRGKTILLTAVILLVAIGGYKFVANFLQRRALEAEAAAGPRVRVAKVQKGLGEHRVTVIGETRPYQSATLYAKVSGYLKTVDVDKGDIVQENQVLAIIESPETDEAYLAALADAKNKRAILARTKILYDKQLVSAQEFDQAQADASVSEAKFRAQHQLKDYEVLRAPFTGTITGRFADPGALVQNASNSESSSLPVVMLSEIKRLRIDVFIDQRDAPYVKKDDPVTITLAERPDYKLEGTVARVTGELDPRTKMLLTEIDIPNDERTLVAGSFVSVSLLVKSPPSLEAPVESLVLKDDKSYITAISDSNTLVYKPVEIGSNNGKMLSIISGVEEGQLLALNIGNTLPEGHKLRPIIEAAAKATP